MIISPYTIGTGVPALLVFCVPEKLKEILGSSSGIVGVGIGNNISLTPCKTKDVPRYKDALAKNPDLTLGQFGNLTKSIETFAEGIGLDLGATDLTAANVLEKFAGQKVLGDLGQLKGALSEKELAFIQSLNVGPGTPRESLVLIVDLYKKGNQRAIYRAKLYNDHVAETGNPNKPDKNGKTLFQKEAELFSKPVLTQEIKSRLEGLIPAGSKAKEFQRQQIIANENNINTIRKKFPDAKIGEKYEIRGDTFVKVVN